MRRRCVTVGACLLLLSGCGSLGLGAGARFDDVMRDPKATADQIIEAAGPPDEVARNADGSTMLLWKPFIEPDDDESDLEGATAWRLYDAQRHVVRTWSSPDREDLSLAATGDGFLLTDADSFRGFDKAYAVDHDGRRQKVTVDRGRVVTRPGDVLVEGVELAHAYRPADHALHGLVREPGLPRDAVQWSGAVLDGEGALWVDSYAGSKHWVGWSDDGGRTMTRRILPPQRPGTAPREPVLAVGDGTAAVLTDQYDGDDGPSTGARYLDVLTGDDRDRHRVTADAFPFLGEVDARPDLTVTSDGRVLLGDSDLGEWWVARDPGNTAFVRLDVPGDTAFVRDLGGTLFAWGEFDHRDAVLQTSGDDGATWRTFDVGSPDG